MKSDGKVHEWIEKSDWAQHAVHDPDIRSRTAVCLSFADPALQDAGEDTRKALMAKMADMLMAEQAAYDVRAYKRAPAGFRIWCGGTVEQDDLKAMLPWMDWAYAQARPEF